ncbi:MAG: outer rane immunogenic protein [Sphingomonadales bacterium]|jgi:outer membrane immunogenic protein|nr:outer rane immunogenic protein [Sphingomonadales bacterium]
MKTRFLAAAVLAACPIHAAGAREAGPEASVRAPLAISGFRAEFLGGYDDDGFSSGLLYGARVGYDFAVGDRFLLGVDGEFTDVDTHRTIVIGTQPPLRANDGPDLYVGGRATFAVSRRFRIYGGAGFTRQKQGVFIQASATPPPFGTFAAEKFSYDGLRLSGGAQLLIGRRAFLGAEYRYSHYQDYGNHRGQLVGSLGIRF